MSPVQCVQNNHGMTLMSTLMAAGLVGIIATATTALMTSSVRNQNSVRQDTNFNLLKSEISRIIDNSALCDTALKNPMERRRAIAARSIPYPALSEPLVQPPSLSLVKAKILATALLLKTCHLLDKKIPAGTTLPH